MKIFIFPKASHGVWSFPCSRSNGSEANQLGFAFRGAYQFYGTTGVAGNSNNGDEPSPLWGELPTFPGEFLSLGTAVKSYCQSKIVRTNCQNKRINKRIKVPKTQSFVPRARKCILPIRSHYNIRNKM